MEKKIKTTSTSLHKIVDITDIKQLSVYNTLILEHARMLTKGDRLLAEDIVQEMYINLHKYFEKYPDKIINGGFVSLSLRNTLKNYWETLKRKDNNYDWEKQELVYDESDEEIEEKLKDEVLYEEMERRMEELPWYERKVLEYSLEMHITELARKSGINYQNLVYSLAKAKTKIGIVK